MHTHTYPVHVKVYTHMHAQYSITRKIHLKRILVHGLDENIHGVYIIIYL